MHGLIVVRSLLPMGLAGPCCSSAHQASEVTCFAALLGTAVLSASVLTAAPCIGSVWMHLSLRLGHCRLGQPVWPAGSDGGNWSHLHEHCICYGPDEHRTPADSHRAAGRLCRCRLLSLMYGFTFFCSWGTVLCALAVERILAPPLEHVLAHTAEAVLHPLGCARRVSRVALLQFPVQQGDNSQPLRLHWSCSHSTSLVGALLVAGLLSSMPSNTLARVSAVSVMWHTVVVITLTLVVPMLATSYQPASFVFGKFYDVTHYQTGIKSNPYLFAQVGRLTRLALTVAPAAAVSLPVNAMLTYKSCCNARA